MALSLPMDGSVRERVNIRFTTPSLLVNVRGEGDISNNCDKFFAGFLGVDVRLFGSSAENARIIGGVGCGMVDVGA
jgi:hypothetical protein